MFLRSPAAFHEDQTRLHHVNSDLGDAVSKLPLTPRASIAFSQADVGDVDFRAILLGAAVPSPAFNTDMLLHLQSGTIAVHRRRVAELLIDV